MYEGRQKKLLLVRKNGYTVGQTLRGINHASSVEATGDIPATSQRNQPCVLCDFLFWKHFYRVTNVFHALGPGKRTSQHLTIFQLSKHSNLMMPVNQSANLHGKSLQMRK